MCLYDGQKKSFKCINIYLTDLNLDQPENYACSNNDKLFKLQAYLSTCYILTSICSSRNLASLKALYTDCFQL